MKKVVLKVLIISILSFSHINYVTARSGCCFHHGGVAGCSSSGRQICNDGTLSPSCTCTPTYIYGCTDRNAKNYNASANKDNGSCVYYKYGCTDINSVNYDSIAEKDDGSCIPIVYGCTDSSAKNYNSSANTDDGTCIQFIYGCTDDKAINYDIYANTDDESCIYKEESNIDNYSSKTDNYETIDEDEESGTIGGGLVGLGIIGTIGYFIFKKKK